MNSGRFAKLSLIFLTLTILSAGLACSVAAFYILESPPSNLSTLVGRSSSVVIGKIGNVISTYYYTSSLGDVRGPYFVREVKLVTEVVGSGPLPVYVGGYPYFQQGHEYLFFLQYVDQSACAPSPPSPPCIWPPGFSYQYRTVDGPAGVFLIDHGLLYGLKNPYPQWYDWPTVIQNGTQLSEILSQIRSIDFSTKLPVILMLSVFATILVLADITTLHLKRSRNT